MEPSSSQSSVSEHVNYLKIETVENYMGLHRREVRRQLGLRANKNPREKCLRKWNTEENTPRVNVLGVNDILRE